jgi:aspartate/methionine/tyrosine aminotransferase
VKGKTSPATLFQMFLLFQYHVATMDRKSFGQIGAEGKHFLRISIATGIEDLRKGVERIGEASRDKDGFRVFMQKGEHLY